MYSAGTKGIFQKLTTKGKSNQADIEIYLKEALLSMQLGDGTLEDMVLQRLANSANRYVPLGAPTD